MTARATALVTGASSGLGAALMEVLASRDYSTLGCARSLPRSIGEAGGNSNRQVRTYPLDLTNHESVQHCSEYILRDVKTIDVLIHSAGTVAPDGYAPEAARGPIADLDPYALEEMFRIHVSGPAYLTRLLMPILSAEAKIVFITSDRASLSLNKQAGSIGYAVTKAAENMIARKLAAELSQTVVAVHPGWLRTRIGGANAELEPHESASGIVRLIEEVDASRSGQFVDREGTVLPW